MTHYLFKHPEVDFVWVTGGPKIVALANAAGKPGVSVGPGNAPIYIHQTADVKGAVVDILISKTFGWSVICPAGQTCIIDDGTYDEMIAEFERMGARLSPTTRPTRSRTSRSAAATRSRWRPGAERLELATRAGFSVSPTVKVLLAPLPADLEELASHPLVQEKLMPVLAGARAHSSTASTSPSWSPSTGDWDTPRRSTPTTTTSSRRTLWPSHGSHPGQCATAVGALGGIYNNLTPTFSLG